MNWLVVGQGAMGLLWYHHLHQSLKTKSNHNMLSLLASKQQDLQQNQYQFTDLDKCAHRNTLNYASIEQVKNADTVFLCLKSYQIAPAIKQIAAQLKDNCSIILAHNGMGTLERLPQDFIEKHTLYALLTTHGCLRNAPLNIAHTGAGETSLGLISGQSDKTKETQLTLTLDEALPKVSFENNILKKQWLKLAINCAINPITALHNIDNGGVNNSQFNQQISALLSEIVVVAKAEGIELIKEELQANVQKVAQATAKNCSSMRCDILENRQTEIDYINGYIHRLGLKHALATPENSKVWQAIKHLETNF
ncbi:MAG: 2-dehydropantoate 2-reductase [Colwellia sp.]|nr:2-dehydropantoate 2-reductase [Colwellia sp.]MCW8864403.1 2-dehydropantoate 2-reductase [Colwellia sp.]MCW9080816.1 2-dehydropantoate 2-reductase [Colwellia sp.]